MLNKFKSLGTAVLGLLLLTLVIPTACGGKHKKVPPTPNPSPSPFSTPTVLFSVPADGAVDVALNSSVAVTFSQAMDPTTITPTTFSLSQGATAVATTLVYSNSSDVATLLPSAALVNNTAYTATVTTGAKTPDGVGLAHDYVFSFTTGVNTLPALPVNLGSAGNYVILAKAGISAVPAVAITGDMGISPAAATFITGFGLSADASNQWSTSPQVTGKIFAADYAPPTPDQLTTAVNDMQTAFTDAAGRAPDFTELGAGDISGMTLTPGVYKWGTGLLMATDATLTGSPTDVFIFEIAQNLTVADGVVLHLSGGVLPKNIFWQVSGEIDQGTTSHMEGVMLCQTAIVLKTGASINGRLLAQTAAVMDSSVVVQPAP